MRLLTVVLLLWISLVSIARADVIFDDGPPRRYPRPRYPVDLPIAPPVPPPVAVPAADEDWHPNIEPDSETTPDGSEFVILAILFVATASYAVRDRRSDRRPA
jgi:hypothetical protein